MEGLGLGSWPNSWKITQVQTLHLEGVRTTSEMTDNGQNYIAHAAVTLKATACPKCNHDKLYGFGTRSVRIVDLPIHGKQVLINLERQRYMCRKCKHAFMPAHPEIDSEFRLTTRAVKWIEREVLRQTFAYVSSVIGIDEITVRRVFWRYAQNREKTLKPTAGRVLGIDELYLLNEFRCIITNLEDNTVVDLLKDRDRRRVQRYLRDLDGIKNVERVCIDMWRPYRDAVKTIMPGVPITVDKFHVLKWANHTMEMIRKETQRKLPPGQKLSLMRSRHILLRREANLEPRELKQIKRWGRVYPALIDAWKLKEQFYRIYDHTSAEAAKEAFTQWRYDLPITCHYQFRELTKMVENWKDEIFNYFDERITNSFTECANGLAKITNRTGRGHSFAVIRFKVLFAHKLEAFKRRSIRSRMAVLGVPFSTFDDSIWTDS